GEEELISALELAHGEIKKLCQLQIELAERAGQPKWADGAVTESLRTTDADVLRRQRVQFGFVQLGTEVREGAVYPHVKEQFGDAIRALTDAEQDSKELKSAKRNALYERIVNTIQLPFPSRTDGEGDGQGPLDAVTRSAVLATCDKLYKEIVRTKIAVDKRRPDGRSETEIRGITSSVSVMPRTHGS